MLPIGTRPRYYTHKEYIADEEDAQGQIVLIIGKAEVLVHAENLCIADIGTVELRSTSRVHGSEQSANRSMYEAK